MHKVKVILFFLSIAVTIIGIYMARTYRAQDRSAEILELVDSANQQPSPPYEDRDSLVMWYDSLYSKVHEIALANQPPPTLYGSYHLDSDSLSHLTVVIDKWTFGYDEIEEEFKSEHAQELPQFASTQGDFFLLTQGMDTSYVEVIGSTDSTLSLMHFPTGRISAFVRD